MGEIGRRAADGFALRDHENTGAGWALLDNEVKLGRHHVKPWKRCLEVAKLNKATHAFIENDYVCTDYLSEYHLFYSRIFASLPKKTRRVHFFKDKNESIPQAQVFNDSTGNVLREFAERAVDETNPDSTYLGYVVVRPKDLAIVGRTVLAVPSGVPVRTAIDDVVHIQDIELTVRGIPFMEQDARVGVCAHVAIWTCMYCIHRAEGGPRYTIGEIIAEAHKNGETARQGLTVPEAVRLFERLDRSPVWHRDGTVSQAIGSPWRNGVRQVVDKTILLTPIAAVNADAIDELEERRIATEAGEQSWKTPSEEAAAAAQSAAQAAEAAIIARQESLAAPDDETLAATADAADEASMVAAKASELATAYEADAKDAGVTDRDPPTIQMYKIAARNHRADFGEILLRTSNSGIPTYVSSGDHAWVVTGHDAVSDLNYKFAINDDQAGPYIVVRDIMRDYEKGRHSDPNGETRPKSHRELADKPKTRYDWKDIVSPMPRSVYLELEYAEANAGASFAGALQQLPSVYRSVGIDVPGWLCAVLQYRESDGLRLRTYVTKATWFRESAAERGLPEPVASTYRSLRSSRHLVVVELIARVDGDYRCIGEATYEATSSKVSPHLISMRIGGLLWEVDRENRVASVQAVPFEFARTGSPGNFGSLGVSP